MSIEKTKVIVDLLATTEGRDKLLKGLSAGLRVLSEYTGSADQKKMASSVSEARSIMRLVGVANNTAKIRDIVVAGRFKFADVAMIIRILGDAVYSTHDNMAYFGKYLKWNPSTVSTLVARSFVGMFWGFLFAVIVDVQALVSMDRNNASFKRDWRARILLLVRNVCDLLAAFSNVKFVKSFNLTPAQSGALGVVSAVISSYENLNKAIDKQGKKAN
jgi:hypothetical protein